MFPDTYHPINNVEDSGQVFPEPRKRHYSKLTFENDLGRVLKRLMDLSLVTGTLILIWPLFLILGILVYLDSPGPVFYPRRVLGKNGRIFHAYKFRTMHTNGAEILAQYPKLQLELKRNYKLKCDPRITTVGSMLRKFSLDELPQLLNVLKGEMSLIGPRIISPEEITNYGECGPELLSVTPGITGLWQISGRSDTTYAERVHLDMVYIRNYSIWLDIKILLKTVPAVITGDGAY